MVIDTDVAALEKSIAHLEESLSSLAEVLLQNRRSLDLMFLQQVGLCRSLGDQCCFYVNNSGVIKDPMVLLRSDCKTDNEKDNKIKDVMNHHLAVYHG